jgi:hypothetical protein
MILFLKITLQILAIGLALLVNRLDYVTTDKRTKAFKKNKSILFWTSIIFLIISIFFTAFDECNNNKEKNELKQEISELKSNTNQGLINDTTLINENINLKNKLIDLQSKNIELSQGLLSSKNEIIDNLIGSDSYGQAKITGLYCKDKEFCYQLNFCNMKEKPLYDVSLLYHNPDEVDKTLYNGIYMEDTENVYKSVNLGNMPPSRCLSLGIPFKLDKDKPLHLFFYIGTRNGVYHQELFCYRTDGSFIATACKLKKYGKKPEMYIDPNFPIPKDKIQWTLKD